MLARHRTLVLCVVALTLTATVLPATAIQPSADSRATALGSVESTTESGPAVSNQTPVEQKRAAIAAIDSVDVGWRFQARLRDRTIDRLNGTLSAYRDEVRVSDHSVFRTDRRALRTLATIARTNRTAAERAADLVVAADLETANTSIDDARFALSRVGHRIDDPRDRRRAERAIERAVRARDRGLRSLDGDDRRLWRSTNRRRVLVHLGAAWLHAQYALDVLDRASPPALTIETRSDPARNGSAPATRTIRGNVSDVRAYELGNVSVSVNGTGVGSAPIDAVPAPGRNASFAVNLTLERPVAEVSVAVTDVNAAPPTWWGRRRSGRRDRSDRNGWRGNEGDGWSGRLGWRSGDSGSETHRSDTDTVRFDGDGLPDTFEVGVVETDPLDPDSDSSVTAADEADDGLPDGGEDFDDDHLITYAEHELGTDPFANDTDADGLPDRYEASLPTLVDPTSADTDSDGVVDGAEDFDGDGLSASDEYENGTSIARPDSDQDGLDDATEVENHGTSPLDVDTDDDGLGDAEELRLDIDPLAADTDGDGVPDGNESYTTTATDDETGVRISIDGRGDVASHLNVENVTQPSGSAFLAGPVVSIENRTGFEAATVTLPIEGNASPADADNLSVYKWSPEDPEPWHHVNSTVDVANGTASAGVSSFSYFTVMDGPEWEEAITATVSPSWPRHESFDDLSGWDVAGDTDLRNGALVVSASKLLELEPDIVVAKDGSGDFERIQPAVDAAAEGNTILVTAGRYREAVVVDTSIRLVGQNATLEGNRVWRGGETGLRVIGNASPTISGFTIEDFEHGVQGRTESSDVWFSGVVVRENRIGFDLRDSGRWTLEETSVVDNHYRGVYFRGFDGDLRISGSEVSGQGNTGIFLSSFTGVAVISDTVISDNGNDGMSITPGGRCECVLYDSNFSNNRDYGISMIKNAGRFRMDGVEMYDNEIGVYLREEVDLAFSDIDLIGHEYGISAGRSSGRFKLSNVDIVGDPQARGPGNPLSRETGIYAAKNSGDWVLEGVRITHNRGRGINAREASGDWNLDDVVISDNGVNLRAPGASGAWDLADVHSGGARTDGIDASDTSGSWSLTSASTTNSGRDGLTIAESTATWDVVRSRFVSNDRYGMDATGTTGVVHISRTEFGENGQAGIEATDAEPSIDASDNWWGQNTGPGPTQTNGNVLTDPYCTSPECQTVATPGVDAAGRLDRPRSAPRLVDSSLAATDRTAERSAASRVTALPENAADITMSARVKGHAADGSTARVLVTGSAGEAVVADVVRTPERFRVQSADLTRFAGETVTVEAVAEGDAELSVDWIDFAIDTDGDGLRDAVERAELGMPAGPRPGAPLSLDPSNPDTDGDGLLDGEELTEVAVGHVSLGIGSSISFRANAAAADPTRNNSDGGGLTDGEEVEAGSDPFVLETLVIGYTIPTMTEGPGDTLDDREPMTVDESNGIHTGGGRDSNLIAWPSRQFFDPLFCIKELTDGPGCAPSWMVGVEPKDDKLYVYLPFVVYAESDEAIGDVPYQMSFDSLSSTTLVKGENVSGRVSPGHSRRGYIVYEIPELRAAEEGQPAAFRSIGQVRIEPDVTGTIFHRENPVSIGRGYSVSTITLLPATEEMLEDTQFVLEKGMNIALAAEAGAAVAMKTGSRARGAVVFLYELAMSQVDTQPKSIEGVALNASLRGIGSFEDQVDRSENEIYRDIFGDGTVRSAGPTVIRQN